MSDIKLKAASGGGSISIKGPSSAGSDTDFLAANGNLTVTGTSTLTGKVTGGGDIECSSGYYQTSSGTNRFSLTHDGANCYLENQIGSFYVKSSDNANPLEVNNNAVTLNNANLVIGTSGKGIDFSATGNSAGSMSNELLDDYEEGTWSPSPRFNNSGSGTSGSFTGQYVKIGQQVTVYFDIIFTDKGTFSGGNLFTVTNLPFTGNSTGYSGFAPGYVHRMSSSKQLMGLINTNNNIEFYMASQGSGGNSDGTNWGDIEDDTRIIGTMTYRV